MLNSVMLGIRAQVRLSMIFLSVGYVIEKKLADKMFNLTKKRFNPPKFYHENVGLGPPVLKRYRTHISLKSFQGLDVLFADMS